MILGGESWVEGKPRRRVGGHHSSGLRVANAHYAARFGERSCS